MTNVKKQFEDLVDATASAAMFSVFEDGGFDYIVHTRVKPGETWKGASDRINPDMEFTNNTDRVVTLGIVLEAYNTEEESPEKEFEGNW